MSSESTRVHAVELMRLDRLRAHPRNYREHPDDELEHLQQNIREHGVYRNVVIASDDVVLAGHGVVEACRRVQLEEIPVVRMEFDSDDARALKVLAADNEIAHLAISDDRALASLLKELSETPLGLLGTGYDPAMLASLVMVTRPRAEIADFDAAAQWVGLPGEINGETVYTLVVRCDSEQARAELIAKLGLDAGVGRHAGRIFSTYWPPRDWDDMEHVRMISAGAAE